MQQFPRPVVCCRLTVLDTRCYKKMAICGQIHEICDRTDRRQCARPRTFLVHVRCLSSWLAMTFWVNKGSIPDRRSEELRGGKGWVSRVRSCWAQYKLKKK